MPAIRLPPVAVMFWKITVRLYIDEQLPHERYSLPKLLTSKFLIVTVPPPLCWNTLSDADFAPPPSTTTRVPLLEPLKVAASSPTSSHQTLISVQLPLQCTPSAAGLPMMRFFSVAPSASSMI